VALVVTAIAVAACGGSIATPSVAPSAAESTVEPAASSSRPTGLSTATPSPLAGPVERSRVFPGPNPGTKVHLRVLDLSGALLEARQALRSEFNGVLIIPDTIAVVGLPGDERSLYIRWTSSVCEGETTVRVDAAIRIIEVVQPPREECDAAGTFVDLVLTFDRPVNGALVQGILIEG
jgi:hypothetical protein